MRDLHRAECWAKELGEPRYDKYPIQVGMAPSPWRVAVASILLRRTRRVNMELVLRQLLAMWPTAGDLARADGSLLEFTVQPCGLWRGRARSLQRFSSAYAGDSWEVFQQLPGVGPYVADAVGLFCFGLTDLDSEDAVLREYVCGIRLTSRP